MNKMMALLAGGSLALTSAMPALADSGSSTSTADEVALVSLYAPSAKSAAVSNAVSSQTIAAPSADFYMALMDYVQSQVAYQGVVYDMFKNMGASQASLDALAASQAQVTNTSLKLVTYIQNALSVA